MAKRLKKKCLILKVDFQKAYDTVNWKYLDYMMGRMGFNSIWRDWMNACVSSNSISVLVNGSPTEEFVAQRGIKQGDPLAPFLFLMAAEGLTGLTKRGEEVGELQGFQVSDNLSISLLQFADDTLFICDGSERSVWCLKSLLRAFELVSGLKINFAKSNVIGININENVLNGISCFLACKVGVLPFKFLGVPVGGNPRRSCMWKEVVDSIKVRLSSWRSMKLSMGGRVTLINSVLASLPLYLFSVFKAPKKVIMEIEKIQRRFLWGGNEEQRKMSWVKWTHICKPKQDGGLGVKNLYFFNLSLLSKWRWRMLNGSTSVLWVRVLEARYGVDKPWFGSSLNATLARKSSLWWRDLAQLGEGIHLQSDWFKEVTKKRIGNGKTIKFWTDTWVGMEPLAAIFPSVMDSHGDRDALVSNMGEWTAAGWRWRWNALGVEQFLGRGNDPNFEQVIADFVDFMQGIQLNSMDDDRWIWMIDIPRGFTVKSCYNWMCKQVNHEDPTADDVVKKACKSLWKNDIPSKVLVFCWRLLLKKLPTRENLYKRGIISSPQDITCAFCRREMESIDHLFCTCEVIKKVWEKVYDWLNVHGVVADELVTMYEQVGALVKGKNARRVKGLFWAATVHQVWLARNKIIFNNESTTIRSIVSSIKVVSWGWFIARKGRKSGLNFSDWFHSPLGCISTL